MTETSEQRQWNRERKKTSRTVLSDNFSLQAVVKKGTSLWLSLLLLLWNENEDIIITIQRETLKRIQNTLTQKVSHTHTHLNVG